MRWALARAFGPERGEASWAGRGEKLLGCRCENRPRGKVWAGLFGLEEEVGRAGLVSGFCAGFPFLILTLFPISISNSNPSQMNSNLNLNSFKHSNK